MMECLSTEFHNDYSRHKEVLYLSSFKKKNQLKTDRKKKVAELIINCETKTRSSASTRTVQPTDFMSRFQKRGSCNISTTKTHPKSYKIPQMSVKVGLVLSLKTPWLLFNLNVL